MGIYNDFEYASQKQVEKPRLNCLSLSILPEMGTRINNKIFLILKNN